jgi:hypothetical protein
MQTELFEKTSLFNICLRFKLAAITGSGFSIFSKFCAVFKFNTCIYSCLWTDRTELGGNPLTRFGEISTKFRFFDALLHIFQKYFLKGLIRTFLPTQPSSYINAARTAQKIKIVSRTFVLGSHYWVSILCFCKTMRFSSLTFVFIVACGQTGQNWVGTL